MGKWESRELAIRDLNSLAGFAANWMCVPGNGVRPVFSSVRWFYKVYHRR